MARPTWDEYFFGIMDAVAQRATCDRGKSGCIIVREKRIVATGYVGAPAGVAHCDEAGHEFVTMTNEEGATSQHCIRTTHAEQNAIVHAARFGASLEGSTLYCQMTPCYACAKMILNAGITKVIARKDYHASQRTKEVFEEAGVDLLIIDAEVQKYEKQ